MKVAKLIIALLGSTLLIALLVLPPIIQARRARAAAMAVASPVQGRSEVIVGESIRNDRSPNLRDMKQLPIVKRGEREANKNPKISHSHKDRPDPVVQTGGGAPPTNMPGALLNFDGTPFPGVACNCAPPDTNGEVGNTQYVQIVNEGYQVFDKATGVSTLGPSGIQTVWQGFGGVCENSGDGDPVMLYDQLADRWVISQFAGASVPTDECVAVSTTSDATGTWFRYGFHLGSQLLPHPPPRGWAGRPQHVDERLQHVRDHVPRAAALRVQPLGDARGQRGELHHHRDHRRKHRAGLPAGGPRREHGSPRRRTEPLL